MISSNFLKVIWLVRHVLLLAVSRTIGLLNARFGSSTHRQFMAEGLGKRHNRSAISAASTATRSCCLQGSDRARIALGDGCFPAPVDRTLQGTGPNTRVISAAAIQSKCFGASAQAQLAPFEALTQTFHLQHNDLAQFIGAQAVEE